MTPLSRSDLIPEPDPPSGADLLTAGRAMARDWTVGPSLFAQSTGFASELDYKRARMTERRVMQHAHLGYRDLGKTERALAEITERCADRGVTVDRFGMALDWSMGMPRGERHKMRRGTGVILDAPEDFARLTAATPAALHFGDFMLGFPGAVENVCGALAAGATVIGNLGQYFTFRLPAERDDIAATTATVTALGLIAAQDAPVMVHSNLDDGFAAVFTDFASALGMARVEGHVVEDLIGAPYACCYGHHFPTPLTRLAFQRALAASGIEAPGSMIFGATVLYRGAHDPAGHAENFAGLGSYLMIDAAGQRLTPSGHAVNPVPVTENERIPEIDEVIDAQMFLGRTAGLADGYADLIDLESVDAVRDRLLAGAARFERNCLGGLEAAGIDVADPFEILLALRRMGGREIERRWGPGAPDAAALGGRDPVVPADVVREIAEAADEIVAATPEPQRAALAGKAPKVLLATTDVHEHGKMLVEVALKRLGAEIVDGGVSAEADLLAAAAVAARTDAIAVSTYNGVALSFARAVLTEARRRGFAGPILIGGRLNEVPETSNSSLPVDVGAELQALGVHACRDVESALAVLAALDPRENSARESGIVEAGAGA